MPGNNSDTPSHTTSLAQLSLEVREMRDRLDELIASSKAALARSIAQRERLEPRDVIEKALADRQKAGKPGGLTMAEIRALLGTGNSSAKHHVDQLVRKGKAVVVIRLGEHGKGRQEVCHPDAVAI